MRLLKHSFVHAISAFSLTVLTMIIVGALAPKVCAETVSGFPETVLSNYGEEERQRYSLLSEEAERKRSFRDKLVQRIAQMEQRMPLLENSLRQLDAEIEGLEEELRQLQTKSESMERLRALTAIEAWCEANGAQYNAVECAAFSVPERFVWPLPGYSVITCDFGSGHRGIDISGYEVNGKPIAAARGGKVVHSGWLDSYGYSVFVDHGDGLSTRYAHASQLACAEGERVLPGQTIAYVGSSGYSTGPHLHFEVLKDGVLQDPFDYY